MLKVISMKDKKEDLTTSQSDNQTKNTVTSEEKRTGKKDSTSSQYAESISKAKDHFDDKRVISEEELKIQFLPPLLPSKFSNGLLMQFIINPSSRDKLNFLLPFGFAIGCVSLAISVHRTAVVYVFKSFGSILPYYPKRVKRVQTVAHAINNTLCVVQVVMATVMFSYCVYWKDGVTYDPVNQAKSNYVMKRIWMLNFVISGIAVTCTILTAVAATTIFIFLKFKEKEVDSDYGSKFEDRDDVEIPPRAPTIINMGLSNVLIGLYIGIDDSTVGEKVDLQTLCLCVGVITFMMVMLDNIICVSLHIATRGGSLEIDGILYLKTMHYLR